MTSTVAAAVLEQLNIAYENLGLKKQKEAAMALESLVTLDALLGYLDWDEDDVESLRDAIRGALTLLARGELLLAQILLGSVINMFADA